MSQDTVAKPVFIIGAPRSGTTLLYDILGFHRDLSYVTLNLLRAGIHKEGRILGNRKASLAKMINVIHKTDEDNRPHEANHFWVKYFGTYDYLTKSDFRPEMAQYYRTNVLAVQKVFGRPRFMSKNPQHSFRVGLLDAIFPDAKFIHIVRDGRAVAYSTLKKGEKEPNTTYFVTLEGKILKDKYREERSKLYNYGLAWTVLVNKAMEASKFGSKRYYEVRYEDFIARPVEETKKIIEFCDLDWYGEFASNIPETRDENVKWKAELSESEKYDLEESTAGLRSIFNYA